MKAEEKEENEKYTLIINFPKPEKYPRSMWTKEENKKYTIWDEELDFCLFATDSKEELKMKLNLLNLSLGKEDQIGKNYTSWINYRKRKHFWYGKSFCLI